MNLEIVSPEATLFSGEVNSIIVPGINGQFQLLEHHANIVSILTTGDIKIVASDFTPNKEFENKFQQQEDQKYILPIRSGTIEMKDNNIIILVD